MDVSIYMKGYYEDFHALGRRKNKANSKPISVSPQIYSGGWKTNLKKQSQFQNGKNGVKSYMKGYYGNKPAWGAQKNKANSKPIAGQLCAKI